MKLTRQRSIGVYRWSEDLNTKWLTINKLSLETKLNTNSKKVWKTPEAILSPVYVA